MTDKPAFIRWFKDIGLGDVTAVGGKNASLGELYRELAAAGVRVPNGFAITSDAFRYFFRPILRKIAGTKEFKLVYDEGGSRGVKAVPVPAADRSKHAIGDDEILTLARWGCAIEEHYSRKRGTATPMDIEWGKDGRSGELFVVQARPETAHRAVERASLEHYRLKERGRVLVTGRSVGTKIASGRARVILNVADLGQLQAGEVLVTDKTDPDWEPVMKKAAAIVTNRGGRTCHAAIVSRELGVPAVVGTERATTAVPTGTTVTVSCAEGEIGYVYEGALRFEVERVNVSALGKPATRLMMNVGNPDEAFALSFLPNEGVGLARIEFIISSAIGVHPLALVRYAQLDAEARNAVDRLTAPYADKPAYFVDKLAEGIGTIAAAFYPKNVIVRLSDFKSNEYARLAGGQAFEPVEENPMIGWRGASRYYDERYRDGFALECQAVKKVRDQMGLRNVKIMVPFCRTLDEAPLVARELARHGLSRHDGGLDLYMMVETPANVLQIGDFAAHFDGFSIGSNDLTQLTLGVDRDSPLVARAFDERHPAVRSLIQQAIEGAHRAGRTIGLCGQAPSDYADFVRFLVDCRIDSISLNPDSVLSTIPIVLAAETGRSAASTSHQPAPASA